jgi:hypothetical protein
MEVTLEIPRTGIISCSLFCGIGGSTEKMLFRVVKDVSPELEEEPAHIISCCLHISSCN